jgi:hypothetical protein
VQQFRLADGSQRYYARGAWKSGRGPRGKVIYGLGAWIAPLPTLHLLAVEPAAGFEYLPNLLNVIDLGGGNAGIIFSEHGDDSASLSLVEYRDRRRIRVHTARSLWMRVNFIIFLQNLKYTGRTLGRDRGFTLVAVLILALAIGANIGVFSVVNTLLLRPCHFPSRTNWCGLRRLRQVAISPARPTRQMRMKNSGTRAAHIAT